MRYQNILKATLLSSTMLFAAAPAMAAEPPMLVPVGTGYTLTGAVSVLGDTHGFLLGSTPDGSTSFAFAPPNYFQTLSVLGDQTYVYDLIVADNSVAWVGYTTGSGLDIPFIAIQSVMDNQSTPLPLDEVNTGRAYAVTFDFQKGIIAVGYENNPNNGNAPLATAWVLNSDESIIPLGDPANSSIAYDISDNGYIVGEETLDTVRTAMLWSLDSDLHVTAQQLPTLGSWTQGGAKAISADGTTVVGEIDDGTESLAVRWDPFASTPTVYTLGSLGGIHGVARDVSGDGRIIVGQSNNLAFRWTQLTGMQDLNVVLANAGVDMGGVTLDDAISISDNGNVIAALSDGDGYYVYYDDGFAGATTLDSVHSSIQQLADQQVNMLAEEHTTADLLLANNTAASSDSYTYAGGMFGSAVGYFGGQYVRGDNSIRGGLAFGHQDYNAVKQDNSTTVALAARHIFASDSSLKPYAELGGWATPDEDLTLSRNYANGAGISTGSGTTNAYSWAGYAQAGLIWQAREGTQLRGFGELGQQVLNYDGYTEALSAGNPFPATIDNGQLRYNVTRFGGTVSQAVSGGSVPLTVTASAAIAHAFNVNSNLRATVGGIGSTQAAASDATWGEFGLNLGAQITERWTATVGIIGTSGDSDMNTKLHGTVGLSYKF